mmetsp:Transcript_39307/g.71999  ORF Transcript_39307/g.71999 Transcript_39307/m.71999 type:complete len:183 (-) Transcript_39307:56-604(-)
MNQSRPASPTKPWPLLAFTLLVASSTLGVDASHSSWRQPSLLKRPFHNKLSSELRRPHRRRDDASSSTTDITSVDFNGVTSSIQNAVFCVRGGGEGNGPCIGIDLGTTYSCVAVWRHGRVEICPNELGNRITPSYVAFQPDKSSGGTRLIGDAAKNQAGQNLTNTVFDVKRLIGRKISDATV